jgi:hypothetical protein
MADVVRAAPVQATWTGDTESMVAEHEEHVRAAARRGAEVIGFQEVFDAPHFCQVQAPEHCRWAEQVPYGPTVTRVRALARETGMVTGIDLAKPGTDEADPQAASAVLEAARDGGLLIGEGGGHGTGALRIAPPLSLTVAEAEEGAAILEGALKSLQ